MNDEETVERHTRNYRAIYQELCNSYRAIDDFRTKLLGLLPLATGTGIFLLIMDNDKYNVIKDYLSYIGLFGFFITLGLLFYEMYGIKKCTSLIMEGKRLEQKLGNNYGQFSTRPPGVLNLINEPAAASVIYPAVLGAWTYVAYFDKNNLACAEFQAYLIFAIGFIFVFGYNLYLVQGDIKKSWKKHFGKNE